MAIGAKKWVIPGGHIPGESTGIEPASTSRDAISVLNTGSKDAEINLTIYYEDRDPAGPYSVTVKANRCRSVRINDLINPEAIELEKDYALLAESNVPVVVQFTRIDTSRGNMAFAFMPAIKVD